MTHKQLVELIKPGTQLKIRGVPYVVKQHIVWMQHRAGTPYDKWVIDNENGDDGYRLFIDAKNKAVGFASMIHHNFSEPMPESLEFEGKKYKMVWDEFCTVVEEQGEKVYQKGDGEIWWDYVSLENDQEGLSLGRSWETWQREDLKTWVLKITDVEIS